MDHLVLYGFWRSIATYRVRVALRLKGVAFTERSVDLLAGAQASAEFTALNAARAVPVLVGPGFALTQSEAIIEYLDETCPEPRLLPAEPLARARVRALAQLTIADSHPLITPRVRKRLATEFGASEEQVTGWARHFLAEGLRAYESLIGPAPFIGGAVPGLADIAVASHVVAAKLFGVALDGVPVVAALFGTLNEIPAFSESYPRPPA